MNDAAAVTVPVDASDPLVAVLAWVIAAGAKRALGSRARRYRHAIPSLAVVVAVLLRTAYASLLGQPLDVAVVLRAVAAGAVAVFGHAQFRELVKLAAGADDVVKLTEGSKPRK